MKALITKPNDNNYLFQVGTIVQLEPKDENADYYKVAGMNSYINAESCHIIKPFYEVAKEKEETRKPVEYWSSSKGHWVDQDPGIWDRRYIYRIKPEPPKSIIRPYTYEEAIEIFTKEPWIDFEARCIFQVVAIYESGVVILGADRKTFEQSFESLAKEALHLNGRPCGKEENNGFEY